eukprot:TRINITY_DN28026_c0_g1_i1.p1 TRINITY_DN28026_c0_g1~~TRINITY_DN28026_c0_g1_i1.p1  ORF type:complete len:314 (-),score=58.28 TRINITY_DN28026_c0_g1_i1:14-913(-)
MAAEEIVPTSLHLDIERELEVVQTVYSQERSQIEALAEEVFQDVAEFRRKRASFAASETSSRYEFLWRPLAGPPANLVMPGAVGIESRLFNVSGGVVDFSSPKRRTAIRREVEVDSNSGNSAIFCLTFFPFAGSVPEESTAPAADVGRRVAWEQKQQTHGRSTLPCWRLELSAKEFQGRQDAGCKSFSKVAASLSVLLGLGLPSNSSSSSLVRPHHKDDSSLLAAEMCSGVLQDGSQLVCTGSWPPDYFKATDLAEVLGEVTCSVELLILDNGRTTDDRKARISRYVKETLISETAMVS